MEVTKCLKPSDILDVPVSFFFDGIDERASPWSSGDIFVKRETLEFVRANFRIGNAGAWNSLFELTEAMANLP